MISIYMDELVFVQNFHKSSTGRIIYLAVLVGTITSVPGSLGYTLFKAEITTATAGILEHSLASAFSFFLFFPLGAF